jgi:glycosyltransferase involved in cell wall biosynthesis
LPRKHSYLPDDKGAFDLNSQLVVAVIGLERPEAGGAHNAEALMLGQIQKAISNEEILIVEPLKIHMRPYHHLNRLRVFLRSLYLLWKANPVIWTLTRRFAWIPPTKFERDLKERNVDLVFFVGLYERALELKKIPFIATIWDLGHRDLPALPEMSGNRNFELREWTIKNLATKASALIVDSEVTKVKLKTYYGIEDSIIHSLPFAPKLEEELLQNEKGSFALYPAHYWSHKNHIVLFEAIAQLLSENKKPRQLKLTGQDRGNLKYLIEKVNELQISNYVEFLGFIPKSKLYSLYQQAALVVMPSLLGPTNFPPLESLIRGCPIAVTPSARFNIGNWPGVIELDGHDIPSWSKLLEISSELPTVDVFTIKNHLSQLEASNIEELKSLFMNFKYLKNTHT